MTGRGSRGEAAADGASAPNRATPYGAPHGRPEEPLAHLLTGWATAPIGRRALLARAATLAATLVATPPLGCLRRPSPEQVAQAATHLDSPPWPTIEAAHNHLFPADGNGPSARDLHATAYLRALLDDPEFDGGDADLLRNGARWLDDLAMKREKTPFRDLDPAARERVVAEVAASGPGERWLSTLLLYLFEALLSDPVYGGNPGGAGWQWLAHSPGFPQPAPGRTYRELRKA